jgi:hypothetical protein
MTRKPKAEPTADQVTDEKKADAEAETANGPQTPATGNEGAAEAGEASAASPPAEAAWMEPIEKDVRRAELAELMNRIIGPVVLVKGPAKGRWRAGRLFGPEPVEVAIGDLTEDQQRAIADDPELTVIMKT